MARSDWITPRPDVACGKVFLANRRSAEEHRIALELWILATHHGSMEYRLVPYRCARCGGFHIGRKKATRHFAPTDSSCQPGISPESWGTRDETVQKPLSTHPY